MCQLTVDRMRTSGCGSAEEGEEGDGAEAAKEEDHHASSRRRADSFPASRLRVFVALDTCTKRRRTQRLRSRVFRRRCNSSRTVA
jgi:hypothetical protein